MEIGTLSKVEKTKISIDYSMNVYVVKQTVVRSGRYVSIVNSVGEIMVYTVDHFNGCVKTLQSS